MADNAQNKSLIDAYIGDSYNPDVLSCLANLSNDEVFTPPNVVNQMLDLLPQELFTSPKTKFLDPVCKSGVFLREIAKRLVVGLKYQIPNLQMRVEHIFKNQIYGIAITELTSLVARRSLYCSKYANCDYSVVKFDRPEGNIRFKHCMHTWKDRKCVYCGASETTYGEAARGKKEAHAYELIHCDDPGKIFDMKFDVIVGNPPYQLSDGGQKASATPIYDRFIQQTKTLDPRYILMIIPARWYSGGRGLDSFRREMLKDENIRVLVDYTNSEDCFPGVDIAGGICYFLRDKDNPGKCQVTNIYNGKVKVSSRKLDEYDTFIRYEDSLSIIEKIRSCESVFYDSRVSSQKPFGLRTYVKPNKSGDITLRYGGGTGPFNLCDVTSGLKWVEQWKVIMSYLTYDHAGRPDKDGRRRIFSTMEVLPPKYVCTETYIVIDGFDSKQEAENLLGYLKTNFVRFLVAQMTSTQHISKGNFVFVPVQDFTRPWTDADLYAKYGLTEEEIEFIESMIRPMELDS